MKLRDILNGVSTTLFVESLPDFDITKIENDSRKADKNTLFIAASGYVEDAHPYIENACKNGCRFVVLDINRLDEFRDIFEGVSLIPVRGLHSALAQISKNFYQDPSSKMKVVGITGTSGKTTTAFAVYNALCKLGRKAGLVGTIEYRINNEVIPATNTTPDILFLNHLMHLMVEAGVEFMVMEISSHALMLGRTAGLELDIACFTNFSQDHLDFHKTMEEYLNAKLKIFDLIRDSQKRHKTILVNAETSQFEKIKGHSKKYTDICFKTISVLSQGSDYYAANIELTPDISSYQLNGVPYRIEMIGLTNVYNFSMAAAILQELGFKAADITVPLKDVHVAGRMEKVSNDKGITVIIDYAHKPDALEKVLQTVRDVLRGQGSLITVFGCGGGRDRLKRPIMGRIAALLSDRTIITSDNPRLEDPLSIIKEIEAGCIETGRQNYEIEENREKAIHKALASAQKGDVVVIAGKGHENYQEIGKKKTHFSDLETAEHYLNHHS